MVGRTRRARPRGPGEVAEAKVDLAWGEVYAPDEAAASIAGEIANEIGPGGPYISGMEGLIAAVGRELDATVVSRDSDLTHERTKQVIDVEEY